MSTFHTPGFTSVPRTGVIYVTGRASEAGFYYGNEAWANLGQGAPEVGPLYAEEPRLDTIHLTHSSYEYAPVAGIYELRSAVANLYNTLYRAQHASKYTAENVAICAGGRLALTRIAASVGEINLGHFLPDYTAYEELLNTFHRFKAIPIRMPDETYRLSAVELGSTIQDLGLQAILLSNPCNPTGTVLHGTELQSWIDTARTNECSLIFDEFYSQYVYDTEHSVSAAAYIEDVNTDPIIIVDGLTKNWRYPGLRLSWTVGPVDVIESITSAGSFLDGGAMHAMQQIAIPLLDPTYVRTCGAHIRAHFTKKRDMMVQALTDMGCNTHTPAGGFYCWTNLQQLPPALRDGMQLFTAGLEEKVISVPGVFFDINPGKRRRKSRYQEYSRISFGPSIVELERGLSALQRVIQKHQHI